MKHVFIRTKRRLSPVLAAGLLLQTGGCLINSNELASQLLASILTNLIAGFVFGQFNLPAP